METVFGYVKACVLASIVLLIGASWTQAQMVLNEANAVGLEKFIQTDGAAGCEKPYEGFDYGFVPHSMNNNGVLDPNPGNPFPADIDANGNIFDPTTGLCVDATPETTLPNGWNLANATGFGRVQGNGGDWLELVITQDHTDLRGWTLYWQNDDDLDLIIGTNPDERGYIQFADNKSFADLRAGTIITLSEDAMVLEVRDKFPNDIEFDLGGPDPHATGHVYDLSTDESFDPFSADDWHVHYHVDESLTDVGIATEFFEGFSDIKVDNDLWEMAIFDETNTTVVAEAEDPNVTTTDNNVPAISDFTTGLVQGLVGELRVGASVNSGEMLALRTNPGDPSVTEEYEDVDFSTFGTRNLFNDNTENTLDGVQDFSALRTAVTDNTYDWNASGNASFTDAANWDNARSGNVAAAAPQSDWSVRVSNAGGGTTTAQVTGSTTVSFVTVMSTDSSAVTLEVQNGATLNVVGGDRPGRVLAMAGGVVQVDGGITAAEVEAFSGATISGAGTITGDLINSEGVVNPGSALGTLTVDGDYFQTDGTLLIELGSPNDGDALSVTGAATIGGEIEIDLVGGYIPGAGDSFVIVDAGSFVDAGYTLAGDFAMFDVAVMNDMLTLSFAGGANPDFNNDGDLNCNDVDALVDEIAGAASNLLFDLTGDGMITADDLDAWLTAAGAVNLDSGNRYLDGDANLDGIVDGLDFIEWNDNKFTAAPAWCAGDFNADGIVDGLDFIVWNGNKFMAADNIAAVPEPHGAILCLGALVGLWARCRKRRR